MTTTQAELDALLRRILENPDDDAPRLIYSDALEEMGYALWADFIRNHILRKDEKLPWYDAPNRHLQDPMWAEIVRGAGYWHDYVRFDRGFVNEVRLTCNQFMKYAKELFSTHPITKVTLTDREPRPVAFGSALQYAWFIGAYRGQSHGGAFDLPTELFTYYPFRNNLADGWQYERSLTKAIAALSTACVSYGRSLANLPPLP